MIAEDPSGDGVEESCADLEPQTERSKERQAEDKQFVPVIVKRTDTVRRHPDDMLEKAVDEGLEQVNRATISLTVSSIAAGLILAFTAMSVAVATVAISISDQPILSRLLVSIFYPLGFIMCVMSGTQLFTEHTASAVYPVLVRKATVVGLLRLWGIVMIGNLVGASIGSQLLALAEPVIGAKAGYLTIAEHLIHNENGPLFISAILAGWLMAQGAWLLLTTTHATGQFMAIYLVTFLIGIGGLHHSIAGSAELFTAMALGGNIGPQDAIRFVGLALLGNLVGGSIFVAVLNYTHIRGTQSSEPDS